MTVFSARQLKNLDKYTIEKQGIKSIDLMERAAEKCVEWLCRNFHEENTFSVFCGNGNNGGDGLAIARMLHQKKRKVKCFICNISTEKSEDNKQNINRLKQGSYDFSYIDMAEDLAGTDLTNEIIVDCLFGYGLTRPADDLAKEIIQFVNKASAHKIVSIDIPSGMYCDLLNTPEDAIIQADFTLTFHSPKHSFFFPEAGNYTGKIKILNIGLEHLAFPGEISDFYINEKSIAALLQKRKIFSHKGTYGHAHIIAGSKGKIGAAILATKAALSAGAGLVTATVPSSGEAMLQIAVPTAMCESNYGETVLEGDFITQENFTYGIGPGIGKSLNTVKFLERFLNKIQTPIVLDADALNILSENKKLISKIPSNSILTPHIKEFERLVGKSENSFDRKKKLIFFCKKNNVYVVLKDARTIICTPNGNCFFSLNGSPGMATGGSGDVLTGILTGLLAQKYSPEQTCKIGVVLHGLAGELAAKSHSEYAMTAEDISIHIGKAYKKIIKKEKEFRVKLSFNSDILK